MKYLFYGTATFIRKPNGDDAFQYAHHDIPGLGKIGFVFSELLFAERMAVKFDGYELHTAHDYKEVAGILEAHKAQGILKISYDTAPGGTAGYVNLDNIAAAFRSQNPI